MARRPPVLNIRVRWIGYQNVPETLPARWILPVEELQPIHFFQIKIKGAVAAVDLKGDRVLTTRRKSRCLKRSDSAVSKSSDRCHRIADVYGRSARSAGGPYQ